MRKLFGSIALSMCITAAGANAQELGSFKVGNWQGGAYTKGDTTVFSHCAAVASYKNGLTLIVSITDGGDFLLGLSKDGAGMTVGEQGAAGVAFDGRPALPVRYEVRKPTLLAIGMPTNSAVMNAFRSSRKMDINLGTTHFFFDLDETWRLMPVLTECLRNKSVPQSASLTPAPAPAPPPAVPPRSDDTVSIMRGKFLSQALLEYGRCRQSQITLVVPRSEDSAEDLAQAIRERCAETEQILTNIGAAVFGTSTADMRETVTSALADQKRNLSSDIAEFRAAAAKR